MKTLANKPTTVALVTSRPAPPPGDYLLPLRCLLMGIAEDGQPLALNLNNPSPGSILAIGDPGCGKTRLLGVLAQSARTERPDRVRFGVISPRPAEWRAEADSRHCLGVQWAFDSGGVADLLADMLAFARQGDRGQSRLLLIDGLPDLRNLGAEDRETLSWLVSEGSQYGVYVIATMTTRAALATSGLSPFGASVFGGIAAPDAAVSLADGAPVRQLPHGVFCTPGKHGGWRTFWLPN